MNNIIGYFCKASELKLPTIIYVENQVNLFYMTYFYLSLGLISLGIIHNSYKAFLYSSKQVNNPDCYPRAYRNQINNESVEQKEKIGESESDCSCCSDTSSESELEEGELVE